MIVLTNTSDVIRVTTGAAVALDVHASFVDNTTSTYTPGRQGTPITTATTTTVLASPGANTQRGLKHLTAHARGGANTVTVEHFDGTNAYRLCSVALGAGETLEYEDANGWRVLTALGELKGVGPAGPTGATGATGATGPAASFATQSDQETATSTILAVNPAVQQFHPSAVKVHGSTTGGGTPVLGTAFNVSSIVDAAVGRLTVNYTVAFSSTSYTVVAAVNGLQNRIVEISTFATGSMQLQCIRPDTGAVVDSATGFSWAIFGDQ